MTKHIIVTDTHEGVKNGSDIYHTISAGLFDTIFDYAQTWDIESLIHLGDFWDGRKTIKIKSLLLGFRTIETMSKVFKNVHIIMGNHDLISRDDMNQSILPLFKQYPNIVIVDEPKQLNNILLLPWLFDFEFLKNNLGAEVLMGHFDINGCNMNSSGTKAVNDRFNTSDFENFKKVFSGHFHTPGIYGHIQYLGSPYQMSFNDINSIRGFYVFDDQTLDLHFVEFNDYPKYIRIKDTDNPEDIAGLVPGNIVEFIFTKDHGTMGNIEMVDRVKSWHPLTLSPKYVNINSTIDKSSTNEGVEVKGHLDILFDLFDSSDIPEGINPNVLKKVSETIYKEVQSEAGHSIL